MTRLPVQQTRFQAVLSRTGLGLLGQLRHSWRAGSFSMLALLMGYYLTQNLTVLLLQRVPGGRPMVVLAMVLVIELAVRLRSLQPRQEPPLAWVLVDNLRIGATYAVVLEAFKLGT